MSESFGNYELHKKIAQGGMAEVFLATRTGEIGGFKKQLAIKRIFPHLVDQDEIINMFIDEARIASRLHHPNIVQIYDLGIVDESFFIAMEYVEGLDLRRLCELGIKKGNFIARPLAVHLISEVAAGLEYAHSRTDEAGRAMNIVHRDVSPQNVLISVDGAVKLCDFGIAKAESRLTTTRAGEFKGKFTYMSPEQFGHGTLDHRSDIFTLGILLYETTVGARLFKTRNDYETMRKITEGDVTPPSQLRADYPRELERIVMKSLAIDADERYQSAGELQEELEEWLFEARVRTGVRQLAAYLGSILAQEEEEAEENDKEIEEQQEIEEPAWSLEPTGTVEEVDRFNETVELSMSDAEILEVERSGSQRGWSDRTREEEEATLQGGSTTQDFLGDEGDAGPTMSLVVATDAVEIRRISPEQARLRREQVEDDETEKDFDETLVDRRLDDQTTSPLEHRPPFWELDDGDLEVEEVDATSVDRHIPVDEADEVSGLVDASDSFLGDLPNLPVGGRTLSGIHQVGTDLAQPTGPMKALRTGKRSLSTDITIGRRRVGIAAAVVMTLVLFILMVPKLLPSPKAEAESVNALAAPTANVDWVGDAEVPLRLSTEPAGARVIVNGLLADGETPLEVSLVDGQANEVWVLRRRHRPERFLITADGAPLERSVELERVSATESAGVEFRSVPPGARVLLNGEEMGRTPLRLENVSADFTAHMQFELEGHRPYVALIDLQPRRSHRVKAELAPIEEETVRGEYHYDPRGSRISLGGSFLATTPFEYTHRQGQWLAIEVEGHDRRPRQHRLRLDQIGGFHLAMNLEPTVHQTGRVSIEVQPAAAIYIDSRAFGAGPIEEIELPAGEQTVLFETIEGNRLRVPLEVEADGHRRYLVRIDGEEAQVEETAK